MRAICQCIHFLNFYLAKVLTLPAKELKLLMYNDLRLLAVMPTFNFVIFTLRNSGDNGDKSREISL